MQYLEELEKKVLHLVQKNRELQVRLDATTKENELLHEQSRQFEASLLKETHVIESLVQEKAAIVSSIEELLNSIDALENNMR